MHLVYFDESGNSGNNLDHSQQPMFVLAARKLASLPDKPLNASVIPWVEPLMHRGKESLNDVIAWLQTNQGQKKERPGT